MNQTFIAFSCMLDPPRLEVVPFTRLYRGVGAFLIMVIRGNKNIFKLVGLLG